MRSYRIESFGILICFLSAVSLAIPSHFVEKSVLFSQKLLEQPDITKSWTSHLISYLTHSWQSSYDTKGTAPNDDFEEWLEKQHNRAVYRIVENIGGALGTTDDIADGAVIASPSRFHPDYFYQWTRDAAITVNYLVQRLDDSKFNDTELDLPRVIESYILNSYRLQRLTNPSGNFETLSGLGEPKFMPDSTPFSGPWGRPQRDGPGLRAITISNYLNLLEKYNQEISSDELHNSSFIYEQIIKPDLRYITKYWSSSGFDLWEEIDSYHLFTSLTQLKALMMGMELSSRFKDQEFHTTLVVAFNALRFFILVDSGFQPSDYPFLIETPSLVAKGRRCGLDMASILATLQAHDVDNQDDTLFIPFPVTDSSVMNTLSALVDDMKYRYPINHKYIGLPVGFALGRYPEDIYDGYGISEGNPWFISTATAAELIYKLVYSLSMNSQSIVITPQQMKSLSRVLPIQYVISGQNLVVSSKAESYNVILDSLLKYADTFLQIIKEHVDADGHMSEQFNRYSGFLEGVEDLTWSYGSFWSATRWRSKAIAAVQN